ncbi:MAG: EAL domain-containing protein [Gammaproteobacteria bacterium]|nr:EAL domain-containing protein [Gammaproteobacteria bacterium]
MSHVKIKKNKSLAKSHLPRRGSRAALQAISDGVVVTNEHGMVEFLNPAAELLSGWRTQDAANLPVDKVVHLCDENSGQPMEDTGVWKRPDIACNKVGRCTLQSRSGTQHLIDANVSPVLDADGTVTGTVLVLRDLSQETGLLERLDYQATHDSRTGLLNRSAFEQAVRELHMDPASAGARNAIIYIDVDQFKIINDTCGHVAGDHFLEALSEKLQSRVRESDVLARLGGDEFGVLLRGCTRRHAQALAEQICHLVEDMRFAWGGRLHRHTASVGVTAISEDANVASVLSAAEIACFTAKDQGRNRVHVYHNENVPSRHVEMQWVARISRALDENRLTAFHQPIVPLGDDHSRDERPHYELLVRMTDRFGQIILPKYFISAAERYNLMPSIDRWMVTEVLSRLVWRKDLGPGFKPYTLSINLSGTSLSDTSFMNFLERELERYPIEPRTLCFEITETAAISNIADVANVMRRLKSRGCMFSLDDFGSGLSSFAYLKGLPVDLIKIDGDFIADILNSPADTAFVDAICRVAKAMNIRTVAEHVDSTELLDALSELGVDYAQGYHIAKPRRVHNRSSFALPGSKTPLEAV